MTALRRRAAAGLAASLVVALVLAGCSGSDDQPAPVPSSKAPVPTPDAPRVGRYVAMGDSFTAGPGIAPAVEGSGICFRSQRNYPAQLARRTGAQLVDVSCSGANSDGIVGRTGGSQGQPPQIDALTRDTDLVTVGIGANNNAFFEQLLRSCLGGEDPCTQFVEGTAINMLSLLTQQLTPVLQQVAAAAPRADVILVGYPRLLPEDRDCSSLGVPAGSLPAVRLAESQLDDAMAAAADAAEVTYLSMYQRTGRHDACGGKQAWTNGATVAGNDGVLFHPRLLGMRAVADALADTLAESR